ncbi:MAG: hypothetical protein P8Z42_12230, partial [Anaerolineales bacterium]
VDVTIDDHVSSDGSADVRRALHADGVCVVALFSIMGMAVSTDVLLGVVNNELITEISNAASY